VDGIDFQHHLRSPEQGLVAIEFLTDIDRGGGGTAIRVGSHAMISRLIAAAEPRGLSYSELRHISEGLDDLPVVEAQGRAGDVLLMHPHTVHARSPNAGTRVRIAANRCIALDAPMALDPVSATRSPVERAILAAIRGRPPLD
jgi:ectoine hydroxylase-related dioxygenase (phytanoyl-CoA dioxygenase family)